MPIPRAVTCDAIRAPLVPAYAAPMTAFPEIVVGAPGDSEVLNLPFGVFTVRIPGEQSSGRHLLSSDPWGARRNSIRAWI